MITVQTMNKTLKAFRMTLKSHRKDSIEDNKGLKDRRPKYLADEGKAGGCFIKHRRNKLILSLIKSSFKQIFFICSFA